ncbi:MAG TPA: argininosuccinate synthase [Candidatus Limnocylindria bacterium]|nr:argininosuccinate synthase [Candidatus Limnocylindria bacterium]
MTLTTSRAEADASADPTAETVVLAYSGGLDTSVAVPWLRETRGVEVVTLTVDVGAGAASDAVLARALAGGAKQALAVDAREAFVTDFVWPTLQAGARYQGVYPLATAIARPLIARLLVEVAHQTGATSVAHGCTGKGNDQVRFDVAVAALDPTLKVIAPMRVGMGMNRDEEVAYAQARGIELDFAPSSPYSIDVNLWGRSAEAGILEDPWTAPPADAYAWTVDPADAPREPTEIVIGFANGIPVSLDGQKLGGAELIDRLNQLAGSYGIGRIDHVEDRLVGIKSREVYEAPAAVVLHQAHDAIEGLTLSRELLAFKRQVADRFATLAYDGLWFSELARALRAFVTWTQRHVTGEVRLRFSAGSSAVVGRRSPHSLYDLTLASYGGEDTFDHEAAVGFIKLWGLPVRTQAAVRGPFEDPDEQPLIGRLQTVRREAGTPAATTANGSEPATAGTTPQEEQEQGQEREPAPARRATAPEPAMVVAPLTAGASFQRRARLSDVDAILAINERYARRGILLSRTREEVAEAIDTFRVCELDGEVVGIAALRDYGDGLGELRSLAVMDRAQGRGFGEMLVRAIVKDAKAAGIGKLYVLTANPGYFALHGFEEVPWEDVPEVLDADRASGIARRRWNTAMVLTP